MKIFYKIEQCLEKKCIDNIIQKHFKNPKWKRNRYFQVVAKIKLDEKREVKCGFNLILMRALSVENNEELLLF